VEGLLQRLKRTNPATTENGESCESHSPAVFVSLRDRKKQKMIQGPRMVEANELRLLGIPAGCYTLLDARREEQSWLMAEWILLILIRS
jgi:hypothetical protein